MNEKKSYTCFKISKIFFEPSFIQISNNQISHHWETQIEIIFYAETFTPNHLWQDKLNLETPPIGIESFDQSEARIRVSWSLSTNQESSSFRDLNRKNIQAFLLRIMLKCLDCFTIKQLNKKSRIEQEVDNCCGISDS